MADEQAPPDDPQPPKMRCPVRSCDWEFVVPQDWLDVQVNAEAELHTETHSKLDYLLTISDLQSELLAAHMLVDSHNQRISELESALRGAALVEQGRQGLAVVRDRHHGDVVDIGGKPAKLVGKRLPDHIAKEMGVKPRPRKEPPA